MKSGMTDYGVLVIDEQGLDLDIIDGEPAYLLHSDWTSDQRAAIAAYTVKTSIPGALDVGVSWTEQFSDSNTIIQLSNELQMQIQNEAGSASDAGMNTSTSYSATILTQGGSVGALIMRG